MEGTALPSAPHRGRLVVIVVSAFAAFTLARGGSPAAAQIVATFGQLAIGLLFAWRVGLFDARLPLSAAVPGHSKP